MANRIYALLVGINDYPIDVGKLSGCINDVDQFHDYLRSSCDQASLAVSVLKNSDATRGNIIDQFRDHLGQAGEGDVALFQYCGHGARWASAAAFREFYPDGKDEGLVCFDSRSPGGYDLADKELAVLLAELAKNNPHLAVILDSCHSGSGTRGADEFKGLRARVTHEVATERPLDSYLDGFYSGQQQLFVPTSKHVLLAACERTQKAQEDPVDNCGVFTSTLVEVLNKSRGDLSYADLFVRSRSAIQGRVLNQNPMFETHGQFNANSGFLGRTASSPAARHLVSYDSGGWKMELGAIQGLPTDPEKTVTLALYPEDDHSRSVGTGSVVQVDAMDSKIGLDFDGDETLRYRAEITSLPVPPMSVYFGGDETSRAAIQAAFAADGTANVMLTDVEAGADYALAEQEGFLRLLQLGAGRLVQGAAIVQGNLQASANQLMPALTQICQWERGLALQNPATKMDPALVDFQFAQRWEDAPEVVHDGAEVVLYEVTDNSEEIDFFVRFRVRNRTKQRLHMTLAYYSPEFGVDILQNEPVEPGDAFVSLWGDDEEMEGLRLPEDCNESSDKFKLIVSTEKLDSFLLELDDLPLGDISADGDRAVRNRQPIKKLRHRKEWFTKDLQVRLVRSMDRVSTVESSLGEGKVVVKGHPKFNAKLGLGNAAGGSRSAGDGANFYRAFESLGLEMVNFNAGGTRAGNQNTLELSDIENAASLGDEPLQIELNIPLQDNEVIIPLVHDGQHVLLGGDFFKDAESGHTHISVDHIPQQQAQSRSLTSSLKLYFFKTYLKQSSVNQLRWLEFAADGSFEYQQDGVAAKVAEAQSILLLIHGIIGDTESLARGAFACGLDKQFDLVLSYDYENLSTSIEQTARQFKSDLAGVGLQGGDGKKVTLLAHSMGGLVSRWFVEREAGHEIVEHLVMCGTPNHGSPFGYIDGARKILTMLTTLSLNYMPALAWVSGPFLAALNRSSKITPTLEQMNPNSDFIKDLNESKDPGIRYTVLAGDVKSYIEPSDQFFATLLDKAGKSFAFDALFAGHANDIAVGVDSILHSGGERKFGPVHVNVACHHLNYFDSATGQQALAEVKWG